MEEKPQGTGSGYGWAPPGGDPTGNPYPQPPPLNAVEKPAERPEPENEPQPPQQAASLWERRAPASEHDYRGGLGIYGLVVLLAIALTMPLHAQMGPQLPMPCAPPRLPMPSPINPGWPACPPVKGRSMDATTKLAIEKLAALHSTTLNLLRQTTHLGGDIPVRKAILEAIDKADSEQIAFLEVLRGM